jgi:L-threonylcarbamoyladenylate synthase
MYLSLSEAVDLLNKSEIVAIPTETVYGLAGIATDPIAVEKIYKIKNRPADNPLICHFYSFRQVVSELDKPTDYLPLLVKYFSPGPVSYLVNIKPESSLKVSTCNKNSMVFRIPKHSLCLQLLKELGRPLAAPSANTSGKYSSTNTDMVIADLGHKIAGVLKSKKSKIGLESTILDCRDKNSITILRQGCIGFFELQEFVKNNNLNLEIKTEFKNKEVIPGNKYKHYAPKTKLKLFLELEPLLKFLDSLEKENSIKNSTKTLGLNKVAILSDKQGFEKVGLRFKKYKKILLGKNISEIAQNLYSTFHYLDTLKINLGIVFLANLDLNLSNTKALLDRLNRAVQE